MIQGLHFDFTSKELGEMLDKQIAQHEAKAEEYRKQLDGLANLETGTGSMDAKRDLREHRDVHHGAALSMKLLREHVVPHEIYRLTREDLIEIGVLQRRW